MKPDYLHILSSVECRKSAANCCNVRSRVLVLCPAIRDEANQALVVLRVDWRQLWTKGRSFVISDTPDQIYSATDTFM